MSTKRLTNSGWHIMCFFSSKDFAIDLRTINLMCSSQMKLLEESTWKSFEIRKNRTKGICLSGLFPDNMRASFFYYQFVSAFVFSQILMEFSETFSVLCWTWPFTENHMYFHETHTPRVECALDSYLYNANDRRVLFNSTIFVNQDELLNKKHKYSNISIKISLRVFVVFLDTINSFGQFNI